VTVLEYAVHGQAVRTGQAYRNRFVSVITVKDRKVTTYRCGRERPDPTADQGASQTGRARYPFETKDSRGISSPGSTARVRSG
jgi:hypothetical protein